VGFVWCHVVYSLTACSYESSFDLCLSYESEFWTMNLIMKCPWTSGACAAQVDKVVTVFLLFDANGLRSPPLDSESVELQSTHTVHVYHTQYWQKVKIVHNVVTAASSRGSHMHVACRSACDQDEESWSVKIVFDRLIAPFRGSRSLDSMRLQRTKGSVLIGWY